MKDVFVNSFEPGDLMAEYGLEGYIKLINQVCAGNVALKLKEGKKDDGSQRS